MKRQDLIKYHHQDIDQLQIEVAKLNQQIIDTRLKISLDQEKNVHLVKNMRQDIARLKTLIRTKQLGANTQPKNPTPEPKKPAQTKTQKATQKTKPTKETQ